jgi:hypothetical protein
VGVAQSRSRGLSLRRGAALVALFSAPFLGFAIPAHGDDTPTDPTTSVASEPTTTSVPTSETTAATPVPYDDSTPTTVPTSDTTPSTDPPVTDPPSTDPPVTDPPSTDVPTTDPPVTEPPTTTPVVTDPVTTPTTAPPATDPVTTPSTDAPAKDSTPPAVTSSDPPDASGSGGAGTGKTTKGKAAGAKQKDAPPVRVLLQAFTPGALPPEMTTAKGGVLHATAVAVTIPFKAPLSAAGHALDTLRAQLGASFDPSAPDTSLTGGLSSAAPRFAPWIVLLIMAWLVRTVIASILADRTAGPRRRRWTLL